MTNPHAAAVVARVNAACSNSIPSSANVVSASMAMTNGVCTNSRAKFWAPALEPVFSGGRMTVTPWDRATSPVRSVEQSSMTMISQGV
jgi:hypothetical protein